MKDFFSERQGVYWISYPYVYSEACVDEFPGYTFIKGVAWKVDTTSYDFSAPPVYQRLLVLEKDGKKTIQLSIIVHYEAKNLVSYGISGIEGVGTELFDKLVGSMRTSPFLIEGSEKELVLRA